MDNLPVRRSLRKGPVSCPFCNHVISRDYMAFVSHLRFKHKELSPKERKDITIDVLNRTVPKTS